MIGIYEAVVGNTFIAHRDNMAPLYAMKEFGADAEFPEHHQAATDSMQELNETWHYDTYHAGLSKSLDYKMYSKNGVHISKDIKRVIEEGVTDELVIWRWLPSYKLLEAGMRVYYEILGLVDAKVAISQLNEKNRFTFRL